MATLRSQCRQLQLASGHPTAALRSRAGRPVTPSRARRKSLEQWPSPSIAPSPAPSPCAAPRGTAAAAAAAAEPGGATAAASAAPEAAAEGLAHGEGLDHGAGRPLGAPASTSAPTSASASASTSTSTSTSTPTPTPTPCPSTAASSVRELELRLERATASTAGLALLWAAQRYPQLQAMPGAGGAQLAEAWARAMPGAADALQALHAPQQGSQQEPRGRAERDVLAVCYLRLLWHARPPAAPAAGAAAVAGAAGRAGGGEAASGAAAWERRLLRHLSSSASHAHGGACFGAGSHGAPRPKLRTLCVLTAHALLAHCACAACYGRAYCGCAHSRRC